MQVAADPDPSDDVWLSLWSPNRISTRFVSPSIMAAFDLRLLSSQTSEPPLVLPRWGSHIRAVKRGISFPSSLNLLGFKGLEGKLGPDTVSRDVYHLPEVPTAGKVEQTRQESDQWPSSSEFWCH